ncbi:YicC/YloC family endoribonuclease [Desulfuromonas sp. TF]|uniref:YicC/YloC family endoribonuclease n=1 Tax=Desulfuromonas sp. TF TaxID=1232410 RepID=UPI0003F66B66|nr:YicC/YloC family endoribonuclease [Desulfuromonas sp. TF]
MIKSMTGYGKGQGESEEVTLIVEIRSVNHRYSDVTVKSPRSLLPLEGEIKKIVSRRLKRGKIDIFINQEFAATAAAIPTLNQPLAAAYVEVFERIRTSFPIDGGISLGLLAAQRDLIVLKEAVPDEEAVRSCLDAALEQALDNIEGMRVAEGEATRHDMEARLENVQNMLAQVESRAPQVPQEWQVKIAERLDRLAKDFEWDPQRVAQEIAVFADRCDISEEIIRFKSHLKQFMALFDSAEPVGRQMDFLVQELNREVNTMGSKSNDAELTRMVVSIKSELEKVREQVQNVE